MKNFISCGDYMEVTLAAAIVSGAGLLTNDTFGVASKSGAIGDKVNVALEGVFELPKATGAISQGAKVYWDNTAKNITTTAMGNKLVGVCMAAVLSGDTKVQVRLMDAPHV